MCFIFLEFPVQIIYYFSLCGVVWWQCFGANVSCPCLDNWFMLYENVLVPGKPVHVRKNSLCVW